MNINLRVLEAISKTPNNVIPRSPDSVGTTRNLVFPVKKPKARFFSRLVGIRMTNQPFLRWLLVFIAISTSQYLLAGEYTYISPKPNSILVSNSTNIILRSAEPIDRMSLRTTLIRVTGDRSGIHSGDLTLSDDNRTVIFNPHQPFQGNENVAVSLQRGFATVTGRVLNAYAFEFTTMALSIQPRLSGQSFALQRDYSAAADTLPAPPIKIDSVNNPSSGYIFLATWDRNTPLHKYANYLFILDSMGKIVDSTRVNGAPFDFQIQPNGRLSYGLGAYAGITPGNSNLTHYVLDSTLAKVDSFQMKNGYLTDFHDFILLPNGHAMLMSYHTVTYDMSLVVPGGKPDALLVIDVFQEQDAKKNVVFEWRDIDYIPITDTDLKLTDPRINPSTLNAFELDHDGNLLMSFRNHSDIMKINRETGEVMWRLGGLKNQFMFIGEHAENAPYYFARQHDIHRLDNGNISLFDNGEFHSPWYSRAVEYKLDEVNKTATLVSEYRYSSGNISAQAAGNAHRLNNGGWFVGYGILDPTSPVMRNIVETHADGTTAFELSLPTNVVSYRTSKQPWRQLVNKMMVSIAEVLQGNTYVFTKNGKVTGVSIRFEQMIGDVYNSVAIMRIPYGPLRPEFIADAPIIYPMSIVYNGAAISSHTSEIHIDLNSFPEIKYPSSTSLFIRQIPGQGLFMELPTTYDSTSKELIATTTYFGEIVFGRSDLKQGLATPVLIQPENKKKVLAPNAVLLKWTGRGLLQSFQTQLATDSLFQTIILDTTTTDAFIQKKGLAKNQKYYWHVRAKTSIGSSGWSTVWSFEPTDAYVKVLAPNGKEQIPMGKPFIVRWETNISDSVKVNILRGASSITQVGKTNSSNNAFLWNVSTSLAVDSVYKISVVSYQNAMLGDTSDNYFIIIPSTGVKGETRGFPNAFALQQNFPNPFNPVTTIQFSISDVGTPFRTFLRVYDLLGKQVGELVNEELSPGNYSVSFNAAFLPSGMYLYKLTAGSFSEVRKMILVR